jgi:hypothetical protein
MAKPIFLWKIVNNFQLQINIRINILYNIILLKIFSAMSVFLREA